MKKINDQSWVVLWARKSCSRWWNIYRELSFAKGRTACSVSTISTVGNWVSAICSFHVCLSDDASVPGVFHCCHSLLRALICSDYKLFLFKCLNGGNEGNSSHTHTSRFQYSRAVPQINRVRIYYSDECFPLRKYLFGEQSRARHTRDTDTICYPSLSVPLTHVPFRNIRRLVATTSFVRLLVWEFEMFPTRMTFIIARS